VSGVSIPATTTGGASKQAALELHNMHDIGLPVFQVCKKVVPIANSHNLIIYSVEGRVKKLSLYDICLLS
jgi:hypothetical protein